MYDQTQGVLGDKFIEITAGTSDQDILPSGTTLEARNTKRLHICQSQAALT